MANPFTEPETRSIFEILSTPYSTGYNVMDGMGAIGALTEISGNSTGQAKTQILAYLETMDSDSVTKVKALVVQWDAVRLNITRVDDGTVGENAVSGVTYAASDKQARIRDLVQIYIPFYKWHEVLARRAGQQNSISVATTF